MKGIAMPGAILLSCSFLFGQESRPGPFEARILGALGSEDARQRAAATFVLGRMGDVRHTAALAPLLHDPDLAVRLQVVRALDCWPSLEAGKLLGEAPARGAIWRSKERPNVHFALVLDPWTDAATTLGLDVASVR